MPPLGGAAAASTIVTNPWFMGMQGLLILGGIIWTHMRHQEQFAQTVPLIVIHIGLAILIRPMPAWVHTKVLRINVR